MIIAVTGHRSEKIKDEDATRTILRETLVSAQPDCVLVGMANGVDLWAGFEAISEGIPVWCAIPWKGHTPRQQDLELYTHVLENAFKVDVVVDELNFPGNWVYQKRNEFMVDNATHVLAVWDGSPSGTANCIKYATGRKPIRNVWSETVHV